MTTWYAAIYIVPDEVKTTANRVSLTTKEDAVTVAQDEKDKCGRDGGARREGAAGLRRVRINLRCIDEKQTIVLRNIVPRGKCTLQSN